MTGHWVLYELIYIVNLIIFGWLFIYFLKTRNKSIGNASLAVLTAVATFNEFYLALKTVIDPDKLGFFPALAPLVETEWFFPQILMLIGAIAVAYAVYRYQKG